MLALSEQLKTQQPPTVRSFDLTTGTPGWKAPPQFFYTFISISHVRVERLLAIRHRSRVSTSVRSAKFEMLTAVR